MRRYLTYSCVLLTVSLVTALTARVLASNPNLDFGAFVAEQMSAHSEELFGFRHPLTESALGPYGGADNTQAIVLADGLQATLVSSSVASAADQIALWPNDDDPTSPVRVRRRDIESCRAARGPLSSARLRMPRRS